jgi:hypothetical protein
MKNKLFALTLLFGFINGGFALMVDTMAALNLATAVCENSPESKKTLLQYFFHSL